MKKISFAILISCVLGQVCAQETAPVIKLSHQDAVKIGLDKNLDLNQQKNTLFARQVQKNQSIAAFTPNLYIQGQAARNEGQQQNPENGNFEDLTVDNVGASLNAELTLFNGFNRINTLNQNVQLFRSQSSMVQRTEQDVIFNVTSQYLQVLLDQELLKIAEENHKTQQVVLAQLDEQVALGSKAESEKYTQDAQVKNMELIALRARVTLDNDKALLAQTLQLDPAIPFEVTFPDFQDEYSLENIVLDSLYTLALENRADLKQQDYLMKANRWAYKGASNGYYPRVTLFANYGTVYYSTFKSPFKDQFWDQNPNLTYGVSFFIPIYDRFLTRTTRVINKVTYENSKLQRDNLEKTIKIDVQRAHNNYRAAIQAYHASQAQFHAGELALKTQQESFLLGVSDQVALAQANQTYVQAAASKAQAEVTLVFQNVLLNYALGTLKFEDIQ
jgi:outer membrane protein